MNLISRDRVIAGVEKLRFFPLTVSGGEGAWLIETGGRRLLDLSSTWTACGLGNGHPAVAAALARVAASPPGGGALSAIHDEAVSLAEDLLALVPGAGDRRVYLGHAGSDANDVAIRAARHFTGKPVVVAFEGGYHGGIGQAMAASGVHVAGGSVEASPSVRFVPYPKSDSAAALEALTQALAPSDVACVLVEPILSDGGLIVPPDGFLAEVASSCAAADVLLIADEVKVGLGRTGQMHSYSHDQVTPDLVSFGKALGAGLPISALIGPAAVLDEPGASALLTTAGNPYCSAVARAVLATIEAEGLVDRAAAMGGRLMGGLRDVLDVEVRGRGLMIGVDLGDPRLAAKAVYRAWELGTVVYYVGGGVLEVTPPLIISEAEVDQAISLLAAAITTADQISDDVVAEFTGW